MRMFSAVASILLGILMLAGTWVMYGDPAAPVSTQYGLGMFAGFSAFGVFQLWMRGREKNREM